MARNASSSFPTPTAPIPATSSIMSGWLYGTTPLVHDFIKTNEDFQKEIVKHYGANYLGAVYDVGNIGVLQRRMGRCCTRLSPKKKRSIDSPTLRHLGT